MPDVDAKKRRDADSKGSSDSGPGIGTQGAQVRHLEPSACKTQSAIPMVCVFRAQVRHLESSACKTQSAIPMVCYLSATTLPTDECAIRARILPADSVPDSPRSSVCTPQIKSLVLHKSNAPYCPTALRPSY
eukprot:1192093-Prorocentrum_minimum.AAC.2